MCKLSDPQYRGLSNWSSILKDIIEPSSSSNFASGFAFVVSNFSTAPLSSNCEANSSSVGATNGSAGGTKTSTRVSLDGDEIKVAKQPVKEKSDIDYINAGFVEVSLDDAVEATAYVSYSHPTFCLKQNIKDKRKDNGSRIYVPIRYFQSLGKYPQKVNHRYFGSYKDIYN